jgi:hypothetical protein
MHVKSILDAACGRPAESLSANVTNFLRRKKTPAWYERKKKSETNPPHAEPRHVTTKITRSLAVIMHDLNDIDDILLDKQ